MLTSDVFARLYSSKCFPGEDPPTFLSSSTWQAASLLRSVIFIWSWSLMKALLKPSRVTSASVICPHSLLCSFNQFLSCPELFIHEASWEESEAVLRSIINEQTHREQQINAPRLSTAPECSALNKYGVTTVYFFFFNCLIYLFALVSFSSNMWRF